MKKWLGSKLSKFKISNKYVRICVIAALVIVGFAAVVAIAAAITFNSRVIKTDYEEFVPKEKHHSESEKDSKKNVDLEDKTIMIFGVDKDEARTDTIMVAHLDGESKKMSIVSVPRDTMVYWTDEQIDKIHELDRVYRNPCKITEMSAYGGSDNLRYFTIRTVEEMMDVKVDNYVVINTKVIRELVDKLGGIEVDVPRVMKYDDNYQDLHIDLMPGRQVLNGEQAEGLLRWRHNKNYTEQYALGDLGRIETQQMFVKAFMDKVINDVSLDKIVDIVTSLYSNVKTDVKLDEALKYINYLPCLSVDNMSTQTLPGEGSYENSAWYFIVDQRKMMSMVNQVFYGIEPALAEEWAEEWEDEQEANGQEQSYSEPDEQIQEENNGQTYEEEQLPAEEPLPTEEQPDAIEGEALPSGSPGLENAEEQPGTEVTDPNGLAGGENAGGMPNDNPEAAPGGEAGGENGAVPPEQNNTHPAEVPDQTQVQPSSEAGAQPEQPAGAANPAEANTQPAQEQGQTGVQEMQPAAQS